MSSDSSDSKKVVRGTTSLKPSVGAAASIAESTSSARAPT